MSDYTPTTERMRQMWVGKFTKSWSDRRTIKKYADGFDRWLAQHDAEVRADEREKAIGDAVDRISSACAKARHQRVEVAVLASRNAYTLCEACAGAMRAARGDGEQA